MNNIYDRCPNCMNPYDGSGQLCPYCGQDVMGYVAPKTCLPPFTILQNKYMIGRVLGQGGFGITYIGYDMNLATYVAIKEFYPEVIATRGLAGNALMVTAQSGKDEVYNKTLDKFVVEARNLSKFYGLPGIVSVRNFFYENGTAYIVMDFVAGDNLKKYLADNGGRVDEATVLGLMKPVLESLYEIHKKGLIHRDISPDNIMFDDDGTIKLIDFGAVRGSSAETEMTYTVMLKHGYAPQEQYYAKGNQGPWTDIYSLCATMYKMLTGVVPPNSIERMSEDTYIPPSQCGAVVSQEVDQALTKGLAVNIADRYQNIGELIKDLYGKDYTFMGDGQIGVKEATKPVASNEAQGSKINNKKLIGIVAGAVAALLVIVLCVKAFVLGGDKDDKGTTATTTEVATPADATIEGTTTEATTKEAITLEGQWDEFKFMIDDDYYELPMTYDEWVSHGWIPDMERTVLPGEIEGIRFHNDKMSCSVNVANYGTEIVDMEQCHIIGFLFDYDCYSSDEECIITLPEDIKINTKSYRQSSTIDKAIEKYDHPGYENLGQYISICQWTAEDGSYLTFYGGQGGELYQVEYISFEKPAGASITPSSTVEQTPYQGIYEEIGDTKDRFDDVFNIDGVNYKLWCTVSQFVDNGWVIESESTHLYSNFAEWVVLRKGEASIKVRVANTSLYKLEISQTRVIDISLNVDNLPGIIVILPGGAMMGGYSSDINQLYSDMDIFDEKTKGDKQTQTIYNYAVCDGEITIEVVSYRENSDSDMFVIKEYTYERSYSASRADLDNVDYMNNGITIQSLNAIN
ncbi:MAG: protein kinase [Lachnospiraceae bacterium]|nr:protein kinase [Lachnospiraceae bacterium]